MNCSFCFSYWRNKLKEINTSQAKEAIRLLKTQGLEAINFTGGEPLLREDLRELLKFCKNLNLTTIVTTNGILLKSQIKKLAKYIDFIGLPLDSTNPVVHNKMRKTSYSNDHHKLVLELIDYLHVKYPQIGIKINTVVTKKNAKTISQTGDLIKNKILSWKLSQFIPGAYGKEHQKEYEISVKEFNEVASKCKKEHPEINIICPVAYTQDTGCRILSSEGHLLKPNKNELIDLGSIFENHSEDNDFNQKINVYFFNKTYPKMK
jgi:MoaA/NifB/PqqE/SkfB family radical SAM enzyme